ncbi:MAG: hypothetical protein HZB50_09755 [Chloroflexi bacterium]|nr:hypothetical protein [Chloroflexota bacterium]
MNKFFASILKIFSRTKQKEKPPEPIRCEFCGGTGHLKDECPNSAKFKLFHNDKE